MVASPRVSPSAGPTGSFASLAPIARIGRYEVLGRLAQGGMAEIYLARTTGAKGVRNVIVLKRILPHVASDPSALESFVQEAQLGARLSHPGIAHVLAFEEHQGVALLSMEWVRGVSLRRIISACHGKGGLPPELAARIFANLASALHHAHTAVDEAGAPLRIVHRDVTPENVIVSWQGVPKLLDFGIAKSTVDLQKTEAGVLKGKFAYISPEQYQGQVLDGRSDVFALSVCLYEALSGESLYARSSEFETVAAIVLDPNVPSISDVRPDVPPDLERIVKTGLAKDRDKRAPSADALAQSLERWLADHGHAVRDADVAAFLARIFPGEAQRMPELDRRPPTLPVATGSPSSRPPDAMQRALLGAEADLEAEAMLSGQRARSRGIYAFLFLVLAAALGFLGWEILRRAEAPLPEPATSAPP